MPIEALTHVKKRRVLCIDGGGILGTFPAAFLAQLEVSLRTQIEVASGLPDHDR